MKIKSLIKQSFGYDEQEAFLLHRALIPIERQLPHFVIIGMQKGGTTALTQFLNQHPLVAPPYRKEVCFFDQSYSRGMAYYRRFFPLKSNNKVSYDATPHYFANGQVPGRIKTQLGKTKLVVCVRDPIQRLFSHYRMSIAKKWEKRPLQVAIDAERFCLSFLDLLDLPMKERYISKYSYLSYSLYDKHIEAWLKEFDLSDMHFIFNEDLKNDPHQVFSDLFEFLEIGNESHGDFFQKDFQKTIFTFKDTEVSCEINDETRELLMSDYNNFLKRIGRNE